MKKSFPSIFLLLPVFLILVSGTLFSLDHEFLELPCTDYLGYTYRVSSALGDSYGMDRVFDGDAYTGWSEGRDGPGKGEELWMAVEEGSNTLSLINGFARNSSLHGKNNRVKRIAVSLWYGIQPEGMVSEIGPVYFAAKLSEAVPFELEDTMELQSVVLPFFWNSSIEKTEDIRESFSVYAGAENLPPMVGRADFLIRITLEEVYKGSSWDDTCITELRCFDSRAEIADRVYAEEGALLYSTEAAPPRFLYRERGLLFEPFLLGPRGQWCVAMAVPEEIGGRAETTYHLFRFPLPKLAGPSSFYEKTAEGLIPIDFEESGGRLYLLFDDASRILLNYNYH